MHGAAWQHLVVAKIVQYFWRNREVNPYQWKKLLFGELLLSLKDMAPNYSRPAQALSVTAQMLTVILVLFRWRCKKMHHFWVHNIIRKRLQKNAYHNLAWVASYRILFCDATWINLSYSATSKPPDNLGGNSATPLFCHKSHVLAAWITPPRRNKIQRHFCLLLRLHHNIRNQIRPFAFSTFPIFAVTISISAALLHPANGFLAVEKLASLNCLYHTSPLQLDCWTPLMVYSPWSE